MARLQTGVYGSGARSGVLRGRLVVLSPARHVTRAAPLVARRTRCGSPASVTRPARWSATPCRTPASAPTVGSGPPGLLRPALGAGAGGEGRQTDIRLRQRGGDGLL